MELQVDARPGADAAVEARQMGEQERLLHFLHGFSGLIAAQVLHIRGPLTAGLVRRVLDILQQRHPMLRAHVRYRRLGWRSRLPHIVAESDLDLRATTEIPLREMDGDWELIARRELCTPLPRGRNPRARATLVRAGADGITRLILAVDHAIADAPAMLLLARELMGLLAGQLLPPGGPAGLPPALESRYAKKAGGTYQPAIRLPYRRQRAPRETWHIARRFTQPETAAIHAAARAHKTTIHGTMTAACCWRCATTIASLS